MAIISYSEPPHWIKYDKLAIVSNLVDAKAALISLQTIPFQRAWVDSLQLLQLKREVAGTSRIEGADFTERELDEALKESPQELMTRSQKQAFAAVQAYRWIADLPDDMPLNDDLIRAIHFRIINGADDDHCPPGKLRQNGENVTFGVPRHRGVEGGDECVKIFAAFAMHIQTAYRDHDPLIRALAAHYHLAAMHPFLDGNGRTARALEALLLQRAGLRDACFIAMSNYYYDEKYAYLATLAEVRSKDHDLTPFLIFGLRGIAIQSQRLLEEIRLQNSKALFRNLMYDLFNRLQSPRKRVIARRQIEILKLLLDSFPVDWKSLLEKLWVNYESLSNPRKAIIRDVVSLIELGAVQARTKGDITEFVPRLEWPMEITETEFFNRIRRLPKAKAFSFLS